MGGMKKAPGRRDSEPFLLNTTSEVTCVSAPEGTRTPNPRFRRSPGVPQHLTVSALAVSIFSTFPSLWEGFGTGMVRKHPWRGARHGAGYKEPAWEPQGIPKAPPLNPGHCGRKPDTYNDRQRFPPLYQAGPFGHCSGPCGLRFGDRSRHGTPAIPARCARHLSPALRGALFFALSDPPPRPPPCHQSGTGLSRSLPIVPPPQGASLRDSSLRSAVCPPWLRSQPLLSLSFSPLWQTMPTLQRLPGRPRPTNRSISPTGCTPTATCRTTPPASPRPHTSQSMIPIRREDLATVAS